LASGFRLDIVQLDRLHEKVAFDLVE